MKVFFQVCVCIFFSSSAHEEASPHFSPPQIFFNVPLLLDLHKFRVEVQTLNLPILLLYSGHSSYQLELLTNQQRFGWCIDTWNKVQLFNKEKCPFFGPAAFIHQKRSSPFLELNLCLGKKQLCWCQNYQKVSWMLKVGFESHLEYCHKEFVPWKLCEFHEADP